MDNRADLDRAIPAPPGSRDEGVAWHYGDPHGEQRALILGRGAVDLGHREVIEVSGADRLSWLHSLSTAHLLNLRPGDSRLVLILTPTGHVEHEMHLVVTSNTVLISVEAGSGELLQTYLASMRFMLRVEVAARPDLAVVWEPRSEPERAIPTWLVPADFRVGGQATAAGSDRGGEASRYVNARPADFIGREVFVPRSEVSARIMASGAPAGTWALEALRVAAAVPRIGFETDHRTLPHEVGWIGVAVHLAKGCYRGQEAIARVHNLGRAPRRLALAHLDGSAEILPEHADVVLLDERPVGWVGTAARHHELGPVASVILKRTVPQDSQLLIRTKMGDVTAAQEPVVTP